MSEWMFISAVNWICQSLLALRRRSNWQGFKRIRCESVESLLHRWLMSLALHWQSQGVAMATLKHLSSARLEERAIPRIPSLSPPPPLSHCHRTACHHFASAASVTSPRRRSRLFRSASVIQESVAIHSGNQWRAAGGERSRTKRRDARGFFWLRV